MDVSCDKCQASFKIPDAKVPKGKSFSLKCPKCKVKFTVSPQVKKAPAAAAETAPAPSESPGHPLFDEASTDSYDASERPFDFVEEGVQTALIGEGDPVYRKKIQAALEALEYQVTYPANAREVLKQMRFHVFDMVVINEKFDTPDPDHNNILRYLEMLGMSVRRNIFVAMISDRFRTGDSMAAFHKSVNLIVGVSNIDEVEKVLKHGQEIIVTHN